MNKRQEEILKLYESADAIGWIDYYNTSTEMLDVKESINQLDYDSDKITLAQMAYDFKLASQLISNFIISESQKELYFRLKETNIDLDETLNIELLSNRYSFLGELLELVVTDIEVQQRLISLSDEKLLLFQQLFYKIKDEVSNPIPIITKLLSRLGTSPYQPTYKDNHSYDSLNYMLEEKIKQGIPLSENDKEKLLFIYTSDSKWNVKSLEDLEEFGEKTSTDMIEIEELVEGERNLPVKNITNIQKALLLKSYGISLDTAKTIISKFRAGSIEITDDNRDTMELYLSLYKIVTEKDAGKLIRIFDEFSAQKETKFNYMQPVLIKSELRDMFSQQLNKVTFKTADRPQTVIDGINVYDAGTNFKVIMTSVGAYQAGLEIEDYSKYWNRPQIRSHGNCCSLIANNNLSTAQIRSVCLGFSEFASGMLLRASNTDLNSTVDSRDLDFTIRRGTFMLPDELINSTRGTYNELVYERRDLSKSRQKYKKNPDYIVFFEEFEGENVHELTDQSIENEPDEERRKILKEQKRIWEETKKAAKDFGTLGADGKLIPLPIVKINREECAKSEIQKIQYAFNKYMETKDPYLLPNILTQFENNRVGNRQPHDYIRETYFSKKAMQEMLSQIINTIKGIEDKTLRCDNINAMGVLIQREERNFRNCSQSENQTPGFYHKEYLQILKEMRQLEREGQKR